MDYRKVQKKQEVDLQDAERYIDELDKYAEIDTDVLRLRLLHSIAVSLYYLEMDCDSIRDDVRSRTGEFC